MSNHIIHAERPGHSDSSQETAQPYMFIVLVEDRPGSIDRVIGLMRRRRANMQTLVLGRSEQPDVVRITVVVNDSEVAAHHLVEQLRKLIDVQQVINVTEGQSIVRELALVKVNSTPASYNEIIDTTHHFGAHVVDITPETVTLEVTGSEEKVEQFLQTLQKYGIREIASSGRVAMARGTNNE